MKIIYLLLLIFSFGFANPITLKEKLIKAHKGDYVVFEYNKIFSVVKVFDLDEKNLFLEEITVSKASLDTEINFKKWVEDGALNNSSWTIYKINLTDSKIEAAFSISRNCWINLINNESLVTGLMNLKLKELKNDERKKIGPAPQLGEFDTRALWNPEKILNSKKIKSAKFNAYRSIWPDDGSEFAMKIFDVYFDNSFSFPYFIEINNGHVSYMIKTIDSGSNLYSPIKSFPAKDPEIIEVKKNDTSLVLYLKNSQDLKSFNLFAIDISKDERTIHPLEHQIVIQNNLLLLEVDINFLNNILEKNHKYKLVVNTKFPKDIFIESKNILLWK
ncbi:MAG: hypothetical protein WCT85_07090 [Parachlamydiales bacterium]|jgi:hypothetical protein